MVTPDVKKVVYQLNIKRIIQSKLVMGIADGIMNADGTPGELFLVWRTAALALAGAECLGSIQLPSGSRNLVFAHGEDAMMVVWSDHPADEAIHNRFYPVSSYS